MYICSTLLHVCVYVCFYVHPCSVPALLGTVASLVESCKDADFVVINEEKRLLVSPSAKNDPSTCDGFIVSDSFAECMYILYHKTLKFSYYQIIA